MYPAPMRPTRWACTIVTTPLTSSAAHAAHDKKSSLSPAVRTTIATVRTMGPKVSTQYCSANPMVMGKLGFSGGLEADSGPERLGCGAMGLPLCGWIEGFKERAENVGSVCCPASNVGRLPRGATERPEARFLPGYHPGGSHTSNPRERMVDAAESDSGYSQRRKKATRSRWTMALNRIANPSSAPPKVERG